MVQLPALEVSIEELSSLLLNDPQYANHIAVRKLCCGYGNHNYYKRDELLCFRQSRESILVDISATFTLNPNPMISDCCLTAINLLRCHSYIQRELALQQLLSLQ